MAHQFLYVETVYECTCILQEAYDCLSHKGFYPTWRTLTDCFWWLSLKKDIAWYIKTCHQCQLHSIEKVVIPSTVAVPTPLFHKAYTDLMHMPTSHGYSYIIQAWCSLSAWPEFRVLCRWGGVEEIVTNNSTPFVAALDWLLKKYHINHIHISAYNSCTNMMKT
ncbi:hypothetical protein CY34DRAFT_26194 [Suillus luteus UH-Slu-Lm8-n1]|uniref:Integrase zinc-binding domain-containing protein n=1 Tax=Suillus luteus UH-Slu-Lm8-n1 TaxID=930992 RepID=A0A0D0A5P6_9AGAM|nr:hypothetical protein CY34DRAFT_26194 [Suillus luteus UH-Slu-Lm8-n1]